LGQAHSPPPQAGPRTTLFLSPDETNAHSRSFFFSRHCHSTTELWQRWHPSCLYPVRVAKLVHAATPLLTSHNTPMGAPHPPPISIFPHRQGIAAITVPSLSSKHIHTFPTGAGGSPVLGEANGAEPTEPPSLEPPCTTAVSMARRAAITGLARWASRVPRHQNGFVEIPSLPWWPPRGPSSSKIAVGQATAPWLAAPDRPGRMARKGRPRPVGLGRGLSRPHSLRASRPMGEIGPEALNSFYRFLVRLNNF
jgi:hypothetical protein